MTNEQAIGMVRNLLAAQERVTMACHGTWYVVPTDSKEGEQQDAIEELMDLESIVIEALTTGSVD